MKKIKLLLAAATVLLVSSCSMFIPMGGQRYPYGGNNGNHYGVIRKGTHISDVIRVNGEPDYADSYMNGRNRMDVLYYYQPNWNNRYNSRDRIAVKYTFRNSYLQSTKQEKMKARKNKSRYDRDDDRYYRRYDDRDHRRNKRNKSRWD